MANYYILGRLFPGAKNENAFYDAFTAEEFPLEYLPLKEDDQILLPPDWDPSFVFKFHGSQYHFHVVEGDRVKILIYCPIALEPED